jgi:single-strand DNA-binding protein
MASNSVVLSGRLTKVVEVRTTNNGTKVLNNSLAYDIQGGGSSQDRHAEFQAIVVWAKVAEDMASSAKQGDEIEVTGTLRNRKWVAKDNTNRYTAEIWVTSFKVNHIAKKNQA